MHRIASSYVIRCDGNHREPRTSGKRVKSGITPSIISRVRSTGLYRGVESEATEVAPMKRFFMVGQICKSFLKEWLSSFGGLCPLSSFRDDTDLLDHCWIAPLKYDYEMPPDHCAEGVLCVNPP